MSPVITTYICDQCGDKYNPVFPQDSLGLISQGRRIGYVHWESISCYNCILRGLKGAIVEVRERRDNG